MRRLAQIHAHEIARHERCSSLIAAIYLLRLETTRPETSLTILPLNGGHAILPLPGIAPDDLLVDCGNAQAAQSTLKDFLHAQGVNRLPQLVLTTGEVRNSGGAVALDQIFISESCGRARSTFIPRAITKPSPLSSIPQRDTASPNAATPSAIGLYYIPMPTQLESRADDNALVMIGKIHHTRILLLSDLSRAGQDRLLSLATTNELRADVVVSGLPASGEPLCDELISAIQPRAIVIADSEFPAQRRASPALRDRLAQHSIPVYYTRDHGAVKLVLGQNGWQIIEESRSDAGN